MKSKNDLLLEALLSTDTEKKEYDLLEKKHKIFVKQILNEGSEDVCFFSMSFTIPESKDQGNEYRLLEATLDKLKEAKRAVMLRSGQYLIKTSKTGKEILAIFSPCITQLNASLYVIQVKNNKIDANVGEPKRNKWLKDNKLI